MSGIAGIIHFDGKPVEPGLIEKMTSTMAHRGPDGINHWIKGSVALGQCMLRTTPESLEEHQPLTNEDESLVLVMDGRVDNWEELRRELLGRGAVLRNRTDAELVLRAYETWGRDCLVHIDGDFALVIWDARRREAFCARDRMGNKPFNYHWDSKTFVFASELHTIIELPWVSEILNEGMLAEFLANEWYSRNETFWQGIMRLVAAHWMVVDVSGPRLEQYWLPDLWATLSYTTDEEYIEHYRELFTDVVRRFSRSHKPVAYEVSGGLDSSAVFCVAEHLRRLGRLAVPIINGYTLAFPDDEAANELEYARAVSAHLGVPIHEIAPTLVPLSWYCERARISREFPGYPNGTMSLGLRQQAHTLGAVTILSGLGGDEWLGDCWNTRAYYAEELAARRWRSCLTYLKMDSHVFGVRQATKWFINGMVAQLSRPAREYLRKVWRSVYKNRIVSFQWLNRDLQQLLDGRRESSHRSTSCLVHRFGQLGKLRSLTDSFAFWAVEAEERMAANVGLELRHPLRDPGIVSFSFSTPARLLVRGNTGKFLHRQAMLGFLPERILERTSKAEFSVVFRSQLTELDNFFEQVSINKKEWFGSFDPNFLYRAYGRQMLNELNIAPDMARWLLSSVIGCDALTQ